MNFKHALEAEEAPIKKEDTSFVRLTNAFCFQRDKKEETKAQQSARIKELGWSMRCKWEAYHEENGTWYDYSDNESLYSDSDDEDDQKECDEEYDE